MYYVYLWKDSGACRPLISKSPLRREDVPGDVSIRTIHAAPCENEALDVFRALLEYMPEAGLWTTPEDQEDMARTVSWDGPPNLGRRNSGAATGLGWARNLCRLFS